MSERAKKHHYPIAFTALVLGLGLWLSVVVGLMSPAHAITACGGVLRDGDDLIPADQETKVAAITETTRLNGAQPLIVLLRTNGGRDLDGELTEAITSCPALVEDQESVIAVGITIDDRTVIVHPGSKMAGRIDGDGLAKRMREQVSHTPLEQVLVQAFSTINEQLYDSRNEQVAAKPFIPPTAWGALAVLVLLAGAAGAILVVQKRNALTQARANAETIRDQGMALALNLERDQRSLAKQTKDLAEWMALVEVEPLTRAQVEIDMRTHAVLHDWHALVNQMGTAEGFNAEAYTRYARELAKAHAQMQGAADQMMVIQGNMAQVVTVIDGLDGRLGEIRAKINRANATVDMVSAKGWKVDHAKADLSLASVYTQWAQRARDRQEMLGADEFLRVAEAKADAGATVVENMERTHQDMLQQVVAAKNRHEELEHSLGPAREAMTGLENNFAQRSWESVAGNGSSAQALLAEIPERIAYAESSLDLLIQDMVGAEKELVGIAQDLDAVEGLIDAIHETLGSLQQASRMLPDAIRLADRAVETAIQVAQARENDEGIDDLKAMRERIHRERTHDKPDLRALINAAELLTLQADLWVAQKRGEHAVVEQIERAARSGLDQARARCTHTAQLIGTHQRDLPDSYVQVIEELAEALDDAVHERDPATQLDKATKIRHQAMAVEYEARRVIRTQSKVSPDRDTQTRW